MAKEDLPFPSNREELAGFLRDLFGKAGKLLGSLFEQGRTFVRDFLERRKRECPGCWCMGGRAKKALSLLSRWHKLFEGFQESPQHIYGLLEVAIEKRKIPDIMVSRINHPEAGILSARREYMRVQRMEHVFDICAAPFGTGFFVSWWLGEKQKFSLLLATIIVGLILIIGLAIGLPWWLPLGIGLVIVGLWRLSLRPTYYRLDTALMFQDSVHTAVLEVIDQVTEGKGMRALSELERKPILSDLFRRVVK